jgi:hypothetical protein
METPKVFISYAWTNEDYELEILNIAERLRNDGIDAIIDKWDLTAGQDKYKFMEKMVSDTSISHVLLMLNKEYQTKANERSGGVGTETQIINKDIYDNTEQVKFIPVIMERDEGGNEYVPVFLKNLIYIDFSKEETFIKEYEKLIRIIFKRPQAIKPGLGKPPEYLFEETSNNFDLKESERDLIRELEQNGKQINNKIKQYLKLFNEKLDSCRLSNLNENEIVFGKKLYEKFLEMQNFRDSFLTIVKHLIINGNSDHYKTFYNFFHNFENYYSPKKGTQTSWYKNEFDNFSLFFIELILSNIALLMHYDSTEFLKISLNHTFINDIKYDFEPLEERLSTIFDKIGEIYIIGQYYNHYAGQNYQRPLVEILKMRVYSEITFSELIEADLLLHYYRLNKGEYEQYYPFFYLYHSQSKYEYFSQLIYKDKFKNFLEIFNISSKQEFLNFLNNGNFNYERTRYYRYFIPRLTDIVSEQLLGSK